MILVFADDSTVSIYENEGQVNVDCEGIDVENGVYIIWSCFRCDAL